MAAEARRLAPSLGWPAVGSSVLRAVRRADPAGRTGRDVTSTTTIGFDYLERPERRSRPLRARGSHRSPRGARLLHGRQRAPAGRGHARARLPMPRISLGRLALGFVLAAQVPDGRCRNRMDRTGRWTDGPVTEDCWGRSVWGLGVAAVHHADPVMRATAMDGFDRASQQRSRWPRTMAFAALGAAEVLTAHPGHARARALLQRCRRDHRPHPSRDVAVARATSGLRQRGAGRGLAGGRRRARARCGARSWPGDAGLAPAAGDASRAPLRHGRRWPRSRRPRPAVRPAADRGRRDGRCLLAGIHAHRRSHLVTRRRRGRRLVHG